MATEAAVIGQRVLAGERLTEEQALALLRAPDLLAVGEWAARFKNRRFGNQVFFNVNRHLNYTNCCIHHCAFCAFRRDPEAVDGYLLSPRAAADLAGQAAVDGATELHVVGGLHPELGLAEGCRLLAAIRAAAPGLHLKAFTAVELDHMARLSGLPLAVVLTELRAAGLDSLPGGGAEIFAPRVRRRICPDKISGERWLEVMATAHESGLRSNATMLFGHMETLEERVEHLARLRCLQDRTDGFQAFVALPFQHRNNPLADLPGPTAVDILRTLAVARLFLDNIPHIKAYWVMLGVKLAQVSLAFGVDDLDGTVVVEQIGHAAGAEAPQSLSRADLERQIRVAGCRPVERDSFYRPVTSGMKHA